MEGRLADAAWELEIAERERGGPRRHTRVSHAKDAVDMPDEDAPVPREKVKLLAAQVREIMALRDQQTATTAKMIRACLQRLKSNSSKDRKEALDALDTLATMMENKA